MMGSELRMKLPSGLKDDDKKIGLRYEQGALWAYENLYRDALVCGEVLPEIRSARGGRPLDSDSRDELLNMKLHTQIDRTTAELKQIDVDKIMRGVRKLRKVRPAQSSIYLQRWDTREKKKQISRQGDLLLAIYLPMDGIEEVSLWMNPNHPDDAVAESLLTKWRRNVNGWSCSSTEAQCDRLENDLGDLLLRADASVQSLTSDSTQRSALFHLLELQRKRLNATPHDRGPVIEHYGRIFQRCVLVQPFLSLRYDALFTLKFDADTEILCECAYLGYLRLKELEANTFGLDPSSVLPLQLPLPVSLKARYRSCFYVERPLRGNGCIAFGVGGGLDVEPFQDNDNQQDRQESLLRFIDQRCGFPHSTATQPTFSPTSTDDI